MFWMAFLLDFGVKSAQSILNAVISSSPSSATYLCILIFTDTDPTDFHFELVCPYEIIAGTYLVHSCIKVSLTSD